MPYIKSDLRKYFKGVSYADSPGELNYEITGIVMDYIENSGGMCYFNINTVIGVLECVKQEFYRRMAAPHEDKKKEENGDVYFDKDEPIPYMVCEDVLKWWKEEHGKETKCQKED